ncbi:MAG TPA: cytochrome c oxidase assembly protein [Gaiellaceae bacterium]
MGEWTLDPVPLAAIAVAAIAYSRRARTLRRRGTPVARVRVVSFTLALAVLAAPLFSPIDTIGERRLFSVHMLQHVLIGDVAALLLALGLTGPLLRPVLAVAWLRRLRVLAHPLVALPLWAANLYVWHVPRLYDAALAHASIHALQHALFLSCGVLLWAALLEPLPGPRWFGTGSKLVALAFVWVAGGVLANVFIWSGHPFYSHYHSTLDQHVGGGVMLIEMSLLVVAVFVWLGLGWLRESELRQQLLDRGYAPEAAARAARYRVRRGEEEAASPSP